MSSKYADAFIGNVAGSNGQLLKFLQISADQDDPISHDLVEVFIREKLPMDSCYSFDRP